MRRVSADLALPEPIKSRVLLEMAADLESLYDHYRRGGEAEDDARVLAEDRLLASPEALQGLIMVHTTAYQRLSGRAATRMRWGLDLFLFIVGVVPLLLMSAHVVVSGSSSGAGSYRWTVVGIGLITVGIGIRKAHQVFIRRERSTTLLNQGLATLLFLAALGPVIGGTGFFLSMLEMSERLSGSRVQNPVLVAAAEISSSGTVFTLSILLGIAAGLMWFVLINRIAAVEREESALLLGV